MSDPYQRITKSCESEVEGREVPHGFWLENQVGSRVRTEESSTLEDLRRRRGDDICYIEAARERAARSIGATSVDSLASFHGRDYILLQNIEEEKKSIRLRIAALEAQKRRLVQALTGNDRSRTLTTLVEPRRDSGALFLPELSGISERRRSLQLRASGHGRTSDEKSTIGSGMKEPARKTEDVLFDPIRGFPQQGEVSLGSIATDFELYRQGRAARSKSSHAITLDDVAAHPPHGSSLSTSGFAKRPKKIYSVDSTSSESEDDKRSNAHNEDEEQSGHRLSGIALAIPNDHNLLSPYQVLLRQSLEFFLASEDDIETSQKGRKRKIQLGQVGIRCRFCAHLHPSVQTNGASTFPRAKESIYMCAQNIAMAHMVVPEGRQHDVCRSIPKETLAALIEKKASQSASSVGVDYWAKQGCACNLKEDNGALWLA